MKIATWNINNIRTRLPNLLAWLKTARPDVLCLQELKTADADLPREAIEAAGYGALWLGQKTWNGVAILARGAAPVPVSQGLPDDDPDPRQSRYLEAAVGGTLIASLYAPNGNPQPGPKFDYKLAWTRALASRAGSLAAAGIPVVLAGDFNIVPTEQDIYPGHSYGDDALTQPGPRALWRQMLDQGWTDTIRTALPDDPAFTFWDYRRNRFARDAGLRLDHILISEDLRPRLKAVGIDRSQRAAENASDHAPVWIELE